MGLPPPGCRRPRWHWAARPRNGIHRRHSDRGLHGRHPAGGRRPPPRCSRHPVHCRSRRPESRHHRPSPWSWCIVPVPDRFRCRAPPPHRDGSRAAPHRCARCSSGPCHHRPPAPVPGPCSLSIPRRARRSRRHNRCPGRWTGYGCGGPLPVRHPGRCTTPSWGDRGSRLPPPHSRPRTGRRSPCKSRRPPGARSSVRPPRSPGNAGPGEERSRSASIIASMLPPRAKGPQTRCPSQGRVPHRRRRPSGPGRRGQSPRGNENAWHLPPPVDGAAGPDRQHSNAIDPLLRSGPEKSAERGGLAALPRTADRGCGPRPA